MSMELILNKLLKEKKMTRNDVDRVRNVKKIVKTFMSDEEWHPKHEIISNCGGDGETVI